MTIDQLREVLVQWRLQRAKARGMERYALTNMVKEMEQQLNDKLKEEGLI